MTRERAIRIAEQWSEGHVCSLREGEAEEYHKMCLAALREQEERSKVVTQANRIRAMTDEELAKWLSICGCPDAFSMVGDCESGRCEECWSAWLQQPYISEDIKSSEYIEKDIEGDA